ncbi:hypothetical protein SAMN02910327_01473 [Peptostreptococcaceae bacterium pGA-8]|nr:hypothetical protein SAMN02910327_01473 [Peptostreptococcaceae bacterium pGA-8]
MSDRKQGAYRAKEDFLNCLFLANSQFRGAGFIFKRIHREIWDEPLALAIEKLETAMITTIVYFAGVLGLCALLAKEILGGNLIIAFLGMGAWTAVHMGIIAPLIYYYGLPRPISSHIKQVQDATDEEIAQFLERKKANPRMERLMNKYSHTGNAKYGEQGNRRDKTF